MRKQLNNQFLTKCLLAFLVALLVPQGAWGETTIEYNFTGGLATSEGTWTTSNTCTTSDAGITLTGSSLYLSTTVAQYVKIESIDVYTNITEANLSTSQTYPIRTTCNSSISYTKGSVTDGVFHLTYNSGQSSSAPYFSSGISIYLDIYLAEATTSITISKIVLNVNKIFGVVVNGIGVTTYNASNILGDGKVSFSNGTLKIADGASISGITFNSTSESNIELSGSSTISGLIQWTDTTSNSLSPSALTITKASDATSCSAALNCNSGVISGFSDVTYGVGLYVHSGVPTTYDTTNKTLVSELDNSVNITDATISSTESYNLWVAGTQVTAGNAGNVFSGHETNDGKVSYDASNNTLNLKGATINDGIEYAGTTDLTINLSGTNTINGQLMWYSQSEVVPTLNFTGSSDCSLNLSWSDGTLISGFDNVVYYGVYTSTNTPITYALFNNQYKTLVDAITGDLVYSLTISSTESYKLWVAGTQVTSENKDDVLSTSETNANKVKFDGTNKLTLTGANISMSDKSPAIISGLSSLNVHLVGRSDIDYSSSNVETYAILSTNSSATITFSGEDNTLTEYGQEASLCFNYGTSTYANNPFNGFTSIEYNTDLVFITGTTSAQYVGRLKAPTINVSNNSITLNTNNDYDNGCLSIYYAVDYVDEESQDVSETLYSNSFSFNTKPCTITAYTKYSYNNVEKNSENSLARYYAYAEKPIKEEYTGSAIDMTPTFLPAIESTDGITATFEAGAGNATVSNNTVKMTHIGYGVVSTRFTQDTDANVTLLNSSDSTQCQVVILPPAPTIAQEAGEYLNTQTITITKNDTDENTSILYKWGEDGTETAYSEPITIQEGTLYTWERYSNSQNTYYQTIDGNTTEAAYTLKTDIATCYVDNLVEGTYTGSAITPSFELAIPGLDTSIKLTPETDYTISYKQGETTVDEIVNAGTYTIIATGTGSYGGTKEISYTVNKAAGSISYGTSAINKQVGDANFTNELTKVGDGTIQYASSDYTVATVDESTGEVTIKAGGTATITATATNGSNYTYSETASYTITVAFFTNGSGTEADPYLIETVSDLKNFASQVNNGKINTKYFKLANNIDCTDITDFTPINRFKGTFDGNSCTISNLDGYTSLFGSIGVSGDDAQPGYPGYVKNLTLKNCDFSGETSNLGTIAITLNNGSIENCSVTNCSVTAHKNYSSSTVGGIVAHLYGGTITGCTVSNTTITGVSTITEDSYPTAGGIAAYAYADGGSIAIEVSSNTINAVTVTCGSSYGTPYSGGVIGFSNCSGSTISLTGNTVKGETTITSSNTVTASEAKAGAILGYINADITLENNTYEATVTTTIGSSTNSGFVQRGIGYHNSLEKSSYDVSTNNGAVLYTKTVALASGIEGTIEGYSNYYYDLYDDKLHFAPDTIGKIQITAPDGYAISSSTAPTLNYNTSESVTCTLDETVESGNVYSFTMPDANATLNVTYVKDLSSTIYTLYCRSTYSGSALVPSEITLSQYNQDDVTLTKGTDYEITGYKTSEDKEPIQNVIAAGQYYVTITGKGDYTGTVDVIFNVYQAEPTITAPTAKTLTYTGEDQELVVAGSSKHGTIKYSTTVGGEYTTNIPTGNAVGDYTVYYSITGDENHLDSIYSKSPIEVSISKALPSLKTVPAALPDLTFTGDSLVLISAGATNDGTLYYAVGSEGTYKTTLPKALNAGTYKVYYKIIGDTNHEDSIYSTTPVEVTIAANTTGLTVTLSEDAPETFTYTGEEQTPAVVVKSGETTLTAETDYTISYANNTNAGEATITATGAGNYAGATGSVNFTINKATPTVTAPTVAPGFTYNGDTQALITEKGSTTGGTLYYATNNSSTTAPTEGYSTEVPTGTNAGYYNIWYKVEGDDNYKDIAATYVNYVHIDSAAISYTVEDVSVKYDGEAHGLTVTVTAPTEGYEITYSEDGGSYNLTTSPTLTDVGTRTAYYKIVADNYRTIVGYKSITITQAAGNISYGTTAVEKVYGNEAFTNELTNDGDGTVTYASSDTDVATVDEKGLVTIVGPGTATITATVADGTNYTYEVKEASYTLTVGYQLDVEFASGQTWATYYSKDHFLTVPAGLKAYAVSSVSGTTVNVLELQYIPKGESVLLERTDNTATTFVAKVYTSGIAQYNNLLQASTSDIAVSDIESGDVYVLYNNEFRRATSGTIPAYKGYLTTRTAIAGARLYIGGTTKIDSFDVEGETEQWYSLDGRKLNGRPEREGIYIRNGKKIHVKK